MTTVWPSLKTDIGKEISEMCWKVRNNKLSTKREEGYGEVVKELSIVSDGRCFVRFWIFSVFITASNNATDNVHGLEAHKYIYYLTSAT